jgi:hypothetical protein
MTPPKPSSLMSPTGLVAYPAGKLTRIRVLSTNRVERFPLASCPAWHPFIAVLTIPNHRLARLEMMRGSSYMKNFLSGGINLHMLPLHRSAYLHQYKSTVYLSEMHWRIFALSSTLFLSSVPPLPFSVCLSPSSSGSLPPISSNSNAKCCS